jgi:hypothetical protein
MSAPAGTAEPTQSLYMARRSLVGRIACGGGRGQFCTSAAIPRVTKGVPRCGFLGELAARSQLLVLTIWTDLRRGRQSSSSWTAPCYEIDLSKPNAEVLRGVFGPYIELAAAADPELPDGPVTLSAG